MNTHTLRIRARRTTTATALAALAPLALALSVSQTPAAQATVTATYTWSAGAVVADNDRDWSNPDNWAGGVAPAPGETVSLVFPRLDCTNEGSCFGTTNDIPGLKVSSLLVEAEEMGISGTGFVLQGPLTVRGDTSYYARLDLNIPIRTKGPASGSPGAGQWSVSAGQIFLANVVRGSRVTATLDPTSALRVYAGYVDVPGFQVARLVVRGGHDGLGFDLYDGSANGENGHLVKLKDTQFVWYSNTSTGPIRTTDASILLSAGGYDYSTPAVVNGDLTFDPASDLTLQFYNRIPPLSPPVPGRDFPAIHATGAVALNGLQALVPDLIFCDAPTGTPMAFITGASVTGQLTDPFGNPISDGASFTYNDPDCGPVTARIDYTATSVELTLS